MLWAFSQRTENSTEVVVSSYESAVSVSGHMIKVLLSSVRPFGPEVDSKPTEFDVVGPMDYMHATFCVEVFMLHDVC